MLSYLKTVEQQQARELRSEGWSVRQIQQELGVSRSSVSLWVRDVPLSPEQVLRLCESERRGPIVSGERRAAAARDARSTRV